MQRKKRIRPPTPWPRRRRSKGVGNRLSIENSSSAPLSSPSPVGGSSGSGDRPPGGGGSAPSSQPSSPLTKEECYRVAVSVTSAIVSSLSRKWFAEFLDDAAGTTLLAFAERMETGRFSFCADAQIYVWVRSTIIRTAWGMHSAAKRSGELINKRFPGRFAEESGSSFTPYRPCAADKLAQCRELLAVIARLPLAEQTFIVEYLDRDRPATQGERQRMMILRRRLFIMLELE